MQHVRARKVITRGPIRVVGKFPSIKSGRAHHWESQLERDRMYQLELDPDVISFREQPETYDVCVDGKWCRYTPDLEVRTKYGIVIEEIKPASRVAEYADLFDAASDLIADRGMHFSVVTDTEIRREPFISNISYLLPFRHHEVTEEMLERTESVFGPLQTLPFFALKEAFSLFDLPAWGPWALLAHHFASTDLEAKITDESPITLNRGELPCLQ